ncbi:SURF1 family protein [Streptomyces sp. SID10853]|uniref:SURF1 family cytochrome oxidase biogenesis protein n=1 Tax=Streptomyces sp. SID10853 TaxID=2706028 RepID=UPI0013BF5409|nr:SURF1 family protein [Streptomyces sp. SID10853]
MYRFLLTPRWLGITVFALLAIPFCIFMGSWQLSRFEDRVATHRTDEHRPDPARQASAPLDSLLPVNLDTSGRQASATGKYGRQFLVPDRVVDGKEGSYVLTLLRTDGGKALPVVRGWLPHGAKAPAPPKGAVEVTGSLQASENSGTDGAYTGGGLPADQIGIISAASLVNVVPYPVYDAWITLPQASAGLKAVPAAAPPNSGLDLKSFQNLGYTGEWFVFAGFVVFMWFRLARREAEALRDLELGIVPDPEPVTVVDGEPAAGGSGTDEAAARPAGYGADSSPVR